MENWQGLSEAINLKQSIVQSEQRQLGETDSTATTSPAASQTSLAPLLTQDLKTFARHTLGTQQILHLPASLKKGTLVSYHSPKGLTVHGIVVDPPDQTYEAVFVQELSPKEAQEFMTQNPSLPRLALDDGSVTARSRYPHYGKKSRFVVLVEPIERLVNSAHSSLLSFYESMQKSQQVLLSEYKIIVFLAFLSMTAMIVVVVFFV